MGRERRGLWVISYVFLNIVLIDMMVKTHENPLNIQPLGFDPGVLLEFWGEHQRPGVAVRTLFGMGTSAGIHRRQSNPGGYTTSVPERLMTCCGMFGELLSRVEDGAYIYCTTIVRWQTGIWRLVSTGRVVGNVNVPLGWSDKRSRQYPRREGICWWCQSPLVRELPAIEGS